MYLQVINETENENSKSSFFLAFSNYLIMASNNFKISLLQKNTGIEN